MLATSGQQGILVQFTIAELVTNLTFVVEVSAHYYGFQYFPMVLAIANPDF